MLGTTVFILFIMLVAAANLGLGFAVAVACGVGPQTWPLVLTNAASPHEDEPAHDHTAAAIAPVKPPAAPTPPQSVVDIESLPQIRLSVDEPLEPVAAEVSLESLLTQLSRGFDLFEAELADWDQRRREEDADADHLTNSAIELHSLASGYLEQFQANVAALDSLVGDDSQTSTARAALRQAGDDLAQQLRTTIAELGSLQFESGSTGEATERLDRALPSVLTALRSVCHRLEEPIAELVRANVELSSLATTVIENSQTSLLGRLCFEHLWDISASSGCLGMFDIDNLHTLQEEQGPMAVRRLLQSLGDIAKGLVPVGTPVARLLGKQFAMCFPDTSTSDAVEVVENIRQQIAQTRFTHTDHPLHVSVSCAVVSPQPGEEVVDALRRLRAAIQAAKESGRNCTFLCEGEEPTPVPPAALAVSSPTIAI